MWPPALSSTPAEHGGNYRRGHETHTHTRARAYTHPEGGRKSWSCGRTKSGCGAGRGRFNRRCAQTLRPPHSLLGTTEPGRRELSRAGNQFQESGVERMPVLRMGHACVSGTGCDENSLGQERGGGIRPRLAARCPAEGALTPSRSGGPALLGELRLARGRKRILG